MGIGSVMGGVYTTPATPAKASTSAHNSGAAKAVDDFNAVVGTSQADRLRALKFAQLGLKEEDRKPLDPKQRELENKIHDKIRQAAAHAADPSKVGLVADIKV
ncbi:MAG: hypothetical protein ACXWKY_07070 [Caulobacteraceae bacterium]